MQVPLRKILDLLDPAHEAEVRRAAVTVLGELGQRNGDVHDAVLAALADDDAEVRLRAITAAGKLRVEKALPLLTERIRAGGPEALQAAEVAARLGARGRRLLHELMPHVAPGLRRYIASALAGAGATGAGDVSEVDILLDKDPAVVGAAVQSLASTIPTLDTRHKQALADELLRLAGDSKTVLGAATEAGVIRLAGLLDDARVAPLLWDRILPPHSLEARASALAVLGKWVQSPSKEQRQRLFRCAAESDFRVAAPALMILDKLPVTDKTVSEWLPLFRSPGLPGRRLALSKVGDRDSDEVAEALLGQIGHPDRAFRDEVLERLARSERGRQALAARLCGAETTDAAWPLARVVARFAHADPEAWAKELFPHAADYLEAGDRRADPLLFVLREGSPAVLRDRLEKRAGKLVDKKDFDTAHRIYRVLARDPAAGFPYRLGLATCGLKVSAKELGGEARSHDPCLGIFAELMHQDSAAVLEHLQQTTWLGAEELYYLGFHFAESPEEVLRNFGGAVLRLLLKRFGRNKLAAAATAKLESAGLAEKKGKRK
jgi:HEAT repeat protein